MGQVLMKLEVEDYNRWKELFQSQARRDVRTQQGISGHRVLRSTDNPNQVFVLMEAADLQMTREFSQSDDLRQAMQRGGVMGKPEIYFLEEDTDE
jgi:heme-degrading monooxygenase HmoA